MLLVVEPPLPDALVAALPQATSRTEREKEKNDARAFIAHASRVGGSK